ncbi:MAG: hypothetical protein ACTSR2_14570 [Candidatus Hodarchaeales archaeon]
MVSSTFFLESNRKYSISVLGEYYSWGFGSGELTIRSITTSFDVTYFIPFSFQGDASTEEIFLFDITIPTKGEYRLEYTPIENGLQGGVVSIRLSESFVQSITDIHESSLISFGLLGILMSIILAVVNKFVIKSPGRVIDGYTKSYDMREEQDIHSQERFEFEKPKQVYDQVQCPTCGNWSDGLYCEECGTYLRE